MNYLNLHTDFLRSELYLGAEPIERATWLNLLAWCASQENGGVIEGAIEWTDRKWQQLCGVTLEEVETISDLYVYEDGNLMISNYPVDKEAEVKAKRIAGKKGGRPKKVKPAEPLETKEEKPHGSDMLKAESNHQAKTLKTEREGKGKEKGKGVEKIYVPPVVETQKDIFKKRISKLYGRRESTKWSEKENRAFSKIEINEDEMTMIEIYCHKKTGSEYRRRDIMTLLNNWNGEVDRARDFQKTIKKSWSTDEEVIEC